MTHDLTYITTGMFTRFIPHTEAGEHVWGQMASQGHEAILTIHKASVLAQLRIAGYKVRKAPKPKKVTASEIDNLLAELGV
jgi:hypothetical protein